MNRRFRLLSQAVRDRHIGYLAAALIAALSSALAGAQGTGVPSLEELEKQLEQKRAAKRQPAAEAPVSHPRTPAAPEAPRQSSALPTRTDAPRSSYGVPALERLVGGWRISKDHYFDIDGRCSGPRADVWQLSLDAVDSSGKKLTGTFRLDTTLRTEGSRCPASAGSDIVITSTGTAEVTYERGMYSALLRSQDCFGCERIEVAGLPPRTTVTLVLDLYENGELAWVENHTRHAGARTR